jgi:hypothetical protein
MKILTEQKDDVHPPEINITAVSKEIINKFGSA